MYGSMGSKSSGPAEEPKRNHQRERKQYVAQEDDADCCSLCVPWARRLGFTRTAEDPEWQNEHQQDRDSQRYRGVRSLCKHRDKWDVPDDEEKSWNECHDVFLYRYRLPMRATLDLR